LTAAEDICWTTLVTACLRSEHPGAASAACRYSEREVAGAVAHGLKKKKKNQASKPGEPTRAITDVAVWCNTDGGWLGYPPPHPPQQRSKLTRNPRETRVNSYSGGQGPASLQRKKGPKPPNSQSVPGFQGGGLEIGRGLEKGRAKQVVVRAVSRALRM
jgi:hypothetical protein